MRSSLGGILVFAALFILVVALIGLIRGRVTWARIGSRRHAGIALGIGFVVLVLSGIILPKTDKPGAEEPTAVPPIATITSTTVQPTPTTTATTTTSAPGPPSTANVPIAPLAPFPETTPPTPPITTQEPLPTQGYTPPVTTQASPAARYGNCAEAKAAGAAPMHRGEPGYRSALDRDGDGIACDK